MVYGYWSISYDDILQLCLGRKAELNGRMKQHTMLQ